MGIIEKRETSNMEVSVFQFIRNHDYEEIVHWIYQITSKKIFDTKKITMVDSLRRQDEGNLSEDICVPFEENQLLNELKRREPDDIIFNGYYKNVRFTMNIDMSSFNISVGVEKGLFIDWNRFELDMGLNS